MDTNSFVKFSKMHGLGNDFVVIEAISQHINLTDEIIQSLANRHTGIGFDQLLLIKNDTRADFSCRFFNADGSEAEQCGNGLRCVVKFLRDKKITTKNSFSIATKAGDCAATVKENHLIEIAMGVPCFDPESIPFKTPHVKNTYTLTLAEEEKPFEISVLSMGNPHVIHRVESVNTFPVKTIGDKIAKHPSFPKSANVGFMEIIDKNHIRLRTFERGSGETFACGSNACAAVVAGIMNYGLERKVTVTLSYGELFIEWANDQASVKMTGPAVNIFDGFICLA